MTKRIREVYDTDMVAHIWAHQSQSTARNGRNFDFEGPNLYSYSTRIGTMVTDKNGERVALLSKRHWSNTTSGQISKASSACQNVCPVYRVEHFNDHVGNVNRMIDGYTAAIATASRCKIDNVDWQISQSKELLDEAKQYANRFGVSAEFPDHKMHVAAILARVAERKAKQNDPKTAAKRERAKERANEKLRQQYITATGKFDPNEFRRLSYRQRKQLNDFISSCSDEDHTAHLAAIEVSQAEKIAAWRNGETVRLAYSKNALLRIRGDAIETSQGAQFPIEHGTRAFPIILRCRANGKGWVTNGHTVHLGHFRIDGIDPDGTVHAGCHVVKWEEIERIAKELGLLNSETA